MCQPPTWDICHPVGSHQITGRGTTARSLAPGPALSASLEAPNPPPPSCLYLTLCSVTPQKWLHFSRQDAPWETPLPRRLGSASKALGGAESDKSPMI